jgi:hypothetical protein
MHKPFDIVSKQMIDEDPMAWVELLGLPGRSFERGTGNNSGLCEEV